MTVFAKETLPVNLEDEMRRSQSKELVVRRQRARRQNGGDPGQSDQHLPPPRRGPATLSHAAADQPAHNANERTLGLAPRSVETTSAR